MEVVEAVGSQMADYEKAEREREAKEQETAKENESDMLSIGGKYSASKISRFPEGGLIVPSFHSPSRECTSHSECLSVSVQVMPTNHTSRVRGTAMLPAQSPLQLLVFLAKEVLNCPSLEEAYGVGPAY